MKTGKFIVIYGSNNMGKTTQMNLLEDRFEELGLNYKRLKYPIYNIPSGIKLNQILRSFETLSNEEQLLFQDESKLQELFAQNRRDYQDQLGNFLNNGIHVIAEDYTGTGMAWGLTRDVPFYLLEKYNQDLRTPDIALLLHGNRVTSKGTAIEKGHRNEGDTSEIWKKNQTMHMKLAKEYNWSIINANGAIEDVHERLWKEVRKELSI